MSHRLTSNLSSPTCCLSINKKLSKPLFQALIWEKRTLLLGFVKCKTPLTKKHSENDMIGQEPTWNRNPGPRALSFHPSLKYDSDFLTFNLLHLKDHRSIELFSQIPKLSLSPDFPFHTQLNKGCRRNPDSNNWKSCASFDLINDPILSYHILIIDSLTLPLAPHLARKTNGWVPALVPQPVQGSLVPALVPHPEKSQTIYIRNKILTKGRELTSTKEERNHPQVIQRLFVRNLNGKTECISLPSGVVTV